VESNVLKTLRSREYGILRTLLADIRKEAELTQAELAARLYALQSFVSKVEVGERKIDPVECIRWAEACKVSSRQFYARFVTAVEKR
jgi:transcriptional regulator with XRE-family HTH domain